jgi:hypothetical protein
LVLSTLVAAIPIVVSFVLLAVVRMASQWAALITLAVALVIAVLVYGMPKGPGARFDALRSRVRAFPHHLDRDQRHVSETQIREGCDLALGCPPKGYPGSA